MERSEVIQQRLEQWTAATARAISGEPDLDYRSRTVFLNHKASPVAAPYLKLDLSTHNLPDLRGIADAIALRAMKSDESIHQRFSPKGDIAHLIFELLEQLRVESLAPDTLVGIRSNLRSRFLYWAKQSAASSIVENEVGILVFTVLVMAWSRLLSEPIPETIEEVIEATRWGLAEDIGPALRVLKQQREDQPRFAETALQVAEQVASRVEQAPAPSASHQENADHDSDVEQLLSNSGFDLKWLEAGQEPGMSDPALLNDAGQSSASANFNYQVFEKRLDRVQHITKIVRKQQLQTLRDELDEGQRSQLCNVPRIARRLSQIMARPRTSGWSFNYEEGYLDPKKLTQLITTPQERNLYKQVAQQGQSDCVISILIDNSGSMTHHSKQVAALVDTFARACELANITTEILGFTTREWNGGEVAKEWKAASRPSNPGRLNALQHTIYKDSTTVWRRSRTAIAGLLRHDLYRESCDGEALEWAVKRLQERPESNKLIIVISDGSPMDTATAQENGEQYLDHHLKQVTQQIEHRPDIQLCALGVGLDLSAYYSNNMAIATDRHLTTTEYLAICDMINTGRNQ